MFKNWFKKRNEKRTQRLERQRRSRVAPLPPPERTRILTEIGTPQDDSDFATSMVVAAATDNAALGYLAGGNLLGAMIGSSMAHHESEPSVSVPDSPASEPAWCDSSDSSSSSWDSSGSCSSDSSSYDSGTDSSGSDSGGGYDGGSSD